MTHHTGPWAHAPRPARQPFLTAPTLFVAAVFILGLIVGMNAAVTALNVEPWLTETFAPEHPNHPKGY